MDKKIKKKPQKRWQKYPSLANILPPSPHPFPPVTVIEQGLDCLLDTSQFCPSVSVLLGKLSLVLATGSLLWLDGS